MPKISRYNHFQPWRDGFHIAYNAMTGAVALMTEENYAVYQKLAEAFERGEVPELDEQESELLKQLEYGRFVHADDTDDRDTVRFQHYLARYDRTSMGLVIAPTMACNMACEYCYESHSTNRMSAKIVEAIVAFVEKRARHLEKLDVGWYGGEPLLAMDIIKDLTETFLDLGEEYQFDYSASIISNGYLLDRQHVDQLLEYKVKQVQVTLDGPARMHDQKRPLKNGKSSFNTIIENLKYASTKMGVGIRVNVDKSFTTDIIAELLDELARAGFRERVGVYFGLLEPATKVCANISEACYETADFSQVEVEFYRLLLKNGFRIDKLPSPLATFCMTQTVAGHLIDPDGYLYRCFNHVGDREKAMGTIRGDLNFQDENFMRMFRFSPFENETCYQCNLLPICMGGCPARRVDRELSEDEMCEGWKHNLQPMLEIIAMSKQQQLQQQANEQSQPQAAAKE